MLEIGFSLEGVKLVWTFDFRLILAVQISQTAQEVQTLLCHKWRYWQFNNSKRSMVVPAATWRSNYIEPTNYPNLSFPDSTLTRSSNAGRALSALE
ncbi:hypothetical protein N7467_009109 [Penicillium canescens]|nr:hypothetical protein N7467_009109 [Penicillium canescens]